MMRAISKKGLALIQRYEGFLTEPAATPDGNWVVGYGHVRIGEAGEPVSENEAAHLLALDLAPIERVVNENVTTRITQSQFDALVSFAFSVGAEAFASSQVLRRVNAGEFLAAACAMDAWRKGEVAGELDVIGALVRRRAGEKALFLKDLPLTPTPSAVLRAKLDYAASVLGAPIRFAAAPAAGSVAKTAKPEVSTGERLAEILMSEPATEALLLTHVVVDGGDNEDEITTAHAKPVARPVDGASETLRRIYSDRGHEAALPWFRQSASSFGAAGSFEHAGLLALLLLGLALMLLGGAMFASSRDDALQLAGASAFAVPGFAASLAAGFGFLRRARVVAPAQG